MEYDVDMNSSPKTVVPEINDLPVKVVNNPNIYQKDVAQVREGFSPQTNLVRQVGNRGALVTFLKAGNASTLAVVQGVRKTCCRKMPKRTLLPRVKDASARRSIHLCSRLHQRRHT